MVHKGDNFSQDSVHEFDVFCTTDYTTGAAGCFSPAVVPGSHAQQIMRIEIINTKSRAMTNTLWERLKIF